MRNTLPALVLALAVGAICHGQSIQGQIVDEEGNGIPFATIGIAEKNLGTVTFEDGSFSFRLDTDFQEDTLLVSAVGFERRKISYRELLSLDPVEISLGPDIRRLDPVVISPDKLRFYEAGMKKNTSPNHLGISTPLNGVTVAMFIPNDEGPVLVDEIAVTIRQLNMDGAQLRCRIFEVDPQTSLPGRDLLVENLVATSTMKQERLSFSLSEDFWIDQPFFVGFEWVTTKMQYEELQRAREAFPVTFIDSIVAQNPGYNYNVNENKRIQFRDSVGRVVKKVNLTKHQREILDAKDAASPKLQFKIKVKGSRTYTGSPITGRWSKSPHEALISLRVGSKKVPEPTSSTSTEEHLSFMDNSIPIADLDAYLKTQMEQYKIPGFSMAIFDANKVSYHAVKGYADQELQVPVSERTIFEAASLSKPLFAYFVMKYVEQGLIDLDRPLHEYLPYEDAANDDRYRSITARMALSHTTGFPNWRTDYPGDSLFISFDPGTSYQYSGEGYQYLAKVLAHLLDTDDLGLEAAFQKEIAQPLGLGVTKFIQDSHNLENKAQPYKSGERVKHTYDNHLFGAAFSVHSEALDFSRWLMALLRQEGLSEESIAELFRTQVALQADDSNPNEASGWTLGFGEYELSDGTYYGHGGNNYGYSSGFFIDRERQFGAVIFTNADQVSDAIIDIFLFLKDFE